MIYKRVQIVDSHTGGEPTRIILSGGPDLGSGSIYDRWKIFRDRYDNFRNAVVNEPRGGDAWVGGLLCTPDDPDAVAGVIFFNNIGVLSMCGHGTMGLIETLRYLGRIDSGSYKIDTPAGTISAGVDKNGRCTITNVPCFRYLSDIRLNVPGLGPITGDVAWGGNWFFLTEEHRQEISPSNIDVLSDCAGAIRKSLDKAGIYGKDGALIDHIELFGQGDDGIDSRNFVLCPGGAYDRSPCGTGSSAKVACLIDSGKLKPGEVWRQQSIIGSVFELSGIWDNGEVIVSITGEAHVTGEGELVFADNDPFRSGISTQKINLETRHSTD